MDITTMDNLKPKLNEKNGNISSVSSVYFAQVMFLAAALNSIRNLKAAVAGSEQTEVISSPIFS